MSKHIFSIRFRLFAVLSLAAVVLGVAPAALSAVPHLGYGYNTAALESAMGFNWIKIFEVPPTNLPMTTLLRVEANSSISVAELLTDLDNKLAYLNTNNISVAAWEIGNEPNIDASYGWGTTPDVAQYKDRLCAAYTRIKSQLPDAIVVSAGLAPVGRLTDSHQIDDREFVQQLLDTGGGACLDVVGYHPYGYSADYDAAPDVASADPTQNCVQGFCFRGAEKIHEIMQAHGAGDKKLWATEFGWITQPPDYCLSDPSWSGRAWQIVSKDKQASNLVGAYQYADTHWPWMGAMFIFNYNFNQNAGLAECDQMRFYAVKGRAAESALTALSKNTASVAGRLKTNTTTVNWLVGVDEQPLTLTASIDLANWGWQSLVYTATLDNSANLLPAIDNPTGTLSATAQIYLDLSMPAFTRTPGTYTGTLTLNWYAAGAGNNPRQVALQVQVVPEVYRTYLPTITN
jgi:hypothetical protein